MDGMLRTQESLSPEERRELRVIAYSHFPEVLGTGLHKYQKFANWLVLQNQVIPTAIRDFISAGGRGPIVTPVGIFEDMPRVLINLWNLRAEIKRELSTDRKFTEIGIVFSGDSSEMRFKSWASDVKKEIPIVGIDLLLTAIEMD